MNYTCPVCSQSVSEDLLIYRQHTDKHVVDLIKHDHPDWVEKDGVCQKCYDYYKAEIKGSIFGDAPCAIRLRFIKRVFRPFSVFFQGRKK